MLAKLLILCTFLQLASSQILYSQDNSGPLVAALSGLDTMPYLQWIAVLDSLSLDINKYKAEEQAQIKLQYLRAYRENKMADSVWISEWKSTKLVFDSLEIKENYIDLMSLGLDVHKRDHLNLVPGLIIEALQLIEQGYPCNVITHANFYHWLGYCNQYESNFDLGAANYSKSVELLEEAEDDKDIIYSLNGLANCYADLGRYPEAERTFLKAIEIDEKKIRSESVVALLQNLGLVYQEMGQLEKALACSYKALSQSKDEKETAAYLHSNLGVIYQEMNRMDSAQYYLLEGYNRLAKIVGPTNRELLLDLNNLSSFYNQIGNLDQALIYNDKAISIYEENQDTVGLYYALALQTKAIIATKSADNELAIASLIKQRKVLDNIYNYSNQYILTNDCLIGLAYLSERNYKSAEQHIREFLKGYLKYYRSNIEVLTEDNLIDFEKKNNVQLNVIHSKLVLFPEIPQTLLEELVNVKILQKGLSMERESALRTELRENTGNQELYSAWRSAKEALLSAYSSQLPKDSIQILEKKVEAQNKELYLSELGQSLALDKMTYTKVKSKLKDEEVILEFGLHMLEDSSYQYHVFIITRDKPIVYVPLFKADQLEGRMLDVVEFRQAYVDRLYGNAERGLKSAAPLEATLYELLIDPLLPHIEDKKVIYYVPDGLLQRINISAIALDEFEILADRYEVHLIGSARKLMQEEAVIDYPDSAGLIGGLDYNGDDQEIASRSRAGAGWNKLKWTEKEISKVQEYLMQKDYEINLFTGHEASEAVLKSVLSQARRSPRIVHIATHGFFIDHESKNANSYFQNIKNPMMRSGLILSAGNKGWLSPTGTDEEDNIITAAEISEMNLAHTELVVLSACETGLGDITNNQGVFGLQRAFKLAGARYIIMSLWQVPDRETSVFMTEFYRNWIEADLTIRAAFNKTQKEMRDRFFNPFQWAGFVLID